MTPVYYKYGLPGSYDLNWGFKYEAAGRYEVLRLTPSGPIAVKSAPRAGSDSYTARFPARFRGQGQGLGSVANGAHSSSARQTDKI